MFDEDMRYLAASDQWRARWLPEGSAVAGVPVYEHAGWIPERLKQDHQRCLAGETLSCNEDRLEWPDGRVEFVRWRLVPWQRDDKTVGGIIVFSENITESVRARAALWDWNVRSDRLYRDPL